MNENKLVGIWKVVAYEMVKPNGDTVPYFPNPVGYLHYTADGFMFAVVTSADRPKLGITLQELGSTKRPWWKLSYWQAIMNYLKAASQYFTYTGTYEIMNNTVIHHVETDLIPDLMGKERIRSFAFPDENTLILWAEDVPNQKQKLTWRRV